MWQLGGRLSGGREKKKKIPISVHRTVRGDCKNYLPTSYVGGEEGKRIVTDSQPFRKKKRRKKPQERRKQPKAGEIQKPWQLMGKLGRGKHAERDASYKREGESSVLLKYKTPER